MRALIALGAAFLLVQGALPTSARAAAGEPRQVVDDTVQRVLAVLTDESLSNDERARRVEDIAYGVFDFGTMSRLVLGRNWKRLDASQRTDFTREFRQFLANNYRSRVDGYKQEKVEILGQREEARGDVTVRTRILGGDFEGVNVDYRLRNREGQWLVIDVIIEGISLVFNYRDQFKELLSRGGPEELLEQLREKNAAGPAGA